MKFSTFISSSVIAYLCTTGLVQSAPIQARGGSSLYGITYTAKHPDGSCHSAQDVLHYVTDFKKNGIMNIRTYSQECDQLTNIIQAIEKVDTSMSVSAAVWIDGSSGDDEEINTLVSTLSKNKNSAKVVKSITVGNESLFSGRLSKEALIAKIQQVKKQLKNAIPVGTVETPSTFPKEVIDACDTLGVNIHPYFAKVKAEEAGKNLEFQYNEFKNKYGHGKSIFVAETGWPSDGETNGASVPSIPNVQKFVNQLSQMNHINYYYFEAQDSNWKNGGEFGVETHFGLFNGAGKSKVVF
ncbi:unnamed protein product [Cunninghamella blakesleeana]